MSRAVSDNEQTGALSAHQKDAAGDAHVDTSSNCLAVSSQLSCQTRASVRQPLD